MIPGAASVLAELWALLVVVYVVFAMRVYVIAHTFSSWIDPEAPLLTH